MPIRREHAPKCPICEETIVTGEVVIFDHGDLVHVDCKHSHPVPRYLEMSHAAASAVSRPALAR